MRRKSDNGLKPQITPEELIEYIPQVKEICDVEAVQLLEIWTAHQWSRHTGNSWFMRFGRHYDDCSGFVIAHGTDTMAYGSGAFLYGAEHEKADCDYRCAEADRPGDHGREVEPDRQLFICCR